MLPLNGIMRLVPSLVIAWVDIRLINSYLLMRVQLTIGQHTADTVGLKTAIMLLGILSIAVGRGDDFLSSLLKCAHCLFLGFQYFLHYRSTKALYIVTLWKAPLIHSVSTNSWSRFWDK